MNTNERKDINSRESDDDRSRCQIEALPRNLITLQRLAALCAALRARTAKRLRKKRDQTLNSHERLFNPSLVTKERPVESSERAVIHSD